MTDTQAAAEASRLHSRLPLPWGTLVGFILAVLAMLLIGFVTWLSLQSRTESRERVSRTLDVVSNLQQLQAQMINAETGQRGYLLSQADESYLVPYTTALTEIPNAVRQLRAQLADNPRQLDRLATLEQLAQTKLSELAKSIELRRAGETTAALQLIRSDAGKMVMDQVRTLTTEMRAEEQALLREREAQWQQASQFSVWVTAGGSVLLIVLILVAAVTTSRDYRAREQQVWLRTALMQFGSRIQGEQRLSQLGEQVLSFLAGRLQAQVGAVYLATGDGTFRRFAGYAYAPPPGRGDIQPGEGLLGQAAKERRPLQIQDVPEDYLPVSSSLGTTKPRELLIAPAVADGEVQAVIELGFLRPTLAPERELLDRISESLAIAVRASKDRTRLEDLLEETQRQSEELQTQQEELRVSNEELEVQTKALKESQAHLEANQHELSQSNIQLEEYTQMLEQQRDDLAKAQAVLSERAAELGRANQYKSEFLANMSHELRTPLNSSLILAKLLADNPSANLTDEQVKFANNIYAAGNDLLELINDILDLSKIEARQIDVTRENVGVRQLLDNMSQVFKPLADQKDVGFGIEISPEAPVSLQTDSQRLRQILKNLLSNALKFTTQGQVRLNVFVPSGSPDWLAFAVEDSGIGIAREQHGIIFEPFRQADGTTNRRFGGTGLGLSISRELAAMLGGRIELSSELGAGSTFTLLLPQVMPEKTEQPAAPGPVRAIMPAAPTPPRPAAVRDDRSPAAPASGRVLLIVEDDPSFASIIATLAESFQFDCIIASTADEGIELALKRRPTAIVLDMRLPDHTGLTVLDRLKHNPATRHIPVQVISGFDYSQTALEMGAANVLRKPVDREQLITALANLERKATTGQGQVLIVEDNTVQRDSMVKLLQSEQVRPVAVATVAEALEKLRAETFDCMVLDLALPDATGYELLQTMATDDTYSFPPVIVYTARSMSAEEEQQLRRYSKSIIIKGARSPERLLDEVTLFLHRVEASLPAEQQRMLRVARSRESVFDRRRILLVEDDVRNVFAISRVLEPHGAILEIARNGKEAVAALQPGNQIDLVLMDIMMPEMDGFEAMRLIRARDDLRSLPIIALTAKAMPDDRQRCLDAGANDYITKPIDIEKLLSLLRIWMPPQKHGSAH